MIWEQSGLDFMYPAIIVLMAMTFLLRGLCRLSKTAPEQLIGVKPNVRPFESREEYLAARMEMDLELFLDRARLTPPGITRPEKTPPHVDLDAIRKKSEVAKASDLVTPEIMKHLGTPWSAPGGTGGSAGSNPEALRGISSIQLPSGEFLIKNILQNYTNALEMGIEAKKSRFEISQGVRVKTDCWYRLRSTGELMRLREHYSILGPALFQMEGKCYTGHFCDVDIAIPRAGESWAYKKCVVHPGVHASSMTHLVTENDQRAVDLCGDIWKNYTICGCVEPFEYGKGKV